MKKSNKDDSFMVKLNSSRISHREASSLYGSNEVELLAKLTDDRYEITQSKNTKRRYGRINIRR